MSGTGYGGYMWYFTWVLGLGFAVLLAILNALWFEAQDERDNNK